MLLHQNISQQINKDAATNINKEVIKQAGEANIIDTIKIDGTGNSFITFKEQKENFLNRPTIRLLNHTKN